MKELINVKVYKHSDLQQMNWYARELWIGKVVNVCFKWQNLARFSTVFNFTRRKHIWNMWTWPWQTSGHDHDRDVDMAMWSGCHQSDQQLF